MLNLTRRLNETIMIGDDVRIIVREIHASKVILGIEAPQNISVHRTEIYMRIKDERLKKMSCKV